MLDHLVVAARTLEEGAAWVADRLGVATVPGGKHPLMGTHNRLLSLGGRAYLEVIAIDPEASDPGRPRWYALDSPAMRSRLARGPALIHWVESVEDIEAALGEYPARVEVLAVSRGDLRWKIGVPADGSLPCDGACPTLIEWESGHPSERLPPSGCELFAFGAAPSLEARISLPGGAKATLSAGE